MLLVINDQNFSFQKTLAGKVKNGGHVHLEKQMAKKMLSWGPGTKTLLRIPYISSVDRFAENSEAFLKKNSKKKKGPQLVFFVNHVLPFVANFPTCARAPEILSHLPPLVGSVHNKLPSPVLIRQQFGNKVKRKALDNLSERQAKIIHKELKSCNIDTLTVSDINLVRKNIYNARRSLMPHHY